MPSSTSPDGIKYPLSADVVGKLENWFKQLATDAQRALQSRFNTVLSSSVEWNSLKTAGMYRVEGSKQGHAPDGPADTYVVTIAGTRSGTSDVAISQHAVKTGDGGTTGSMPTGVAWTRSYGAGGWSRWACTGGDTGWNEFEYVLGFEAFGAPGQLRWRVLDGVVFIQGAAAAQEFGANSQSFAKGSYLKVTNPNRAALPVWARPSKKVYSAAPATGGRTGICQVNEDGSITMAANYDGYEPEWIGSGISYPVGT